jgi:hypothetical protein
MAGIKTSNEAAATALDGTETIRGVQSGGNVKITGAQLRTYIRTVSGAMVKKAADQTAANYTTATAVAFDAETYDVGGWHDNASNNSRLTVPSGVSYVRVGGCVNVTLTTADTWKVTEIRKNGSNDYDGYAGQSVETGDTSVSITVNSGLLPVSPTDYFELFFQEESDTSITVRSAFTHFWIEAVI